MHEVYFIAKLFHLPQANFIEKSTDKVDAFFWLHFLDLNQRQNYNLYLMLSNNLHAHEQIDNVAFSLFNAYHFL